MERQERWLVIGVVVVIGLLLITDLTIKLARLASPRTSSHVEALTKAKKIAIYQWSVKEKLVFDKSEKLSILKLTLTNADPSGLPKTVALLFSAYHSQWNGLVEVKEGDLVSFRFAKENQEYRQVWLVSTPANFLVLRPKSDLKRTK